MQKTGGVVLGLSVGLVLMMGSGCGGDDGGGTPDAGNGMPSCQPTGDSFDLSGKAGVRAFLNVRINPEGGIPDNQPATSELILLMDITQSGGGVDAVAELCQIQIPEVPLSGQNEPIRLSPGPGLVESIAAVNATGSLSGTSVCDTLTTDSLTILVGAKLDPPTQGALPEADDQGMFVECTPPGASCESATGNGCVCDQESDGKPAATLLAENVPGVDVEEVYADLRTVFSLQGQVWSSDLVRGTVSATLEQGIVGCAKAGGEPCTNAERNAVQVLNPKVEQDPMEPSVFAAVRVDAGMTCQQLVAQKDQIFPR